MSRMSLSEPGSGGNPDLDPPRMPDEHHRPPLYTAVSRTAQQDREQRERDVEEYIMQNVGQPSSGQRRVQSGGFRTGAGGGGSGGRSTLGDAKKKVSGATKNMLNRTAL